MKSLICIFVGGLFLYAPAELTRIIVRDMFPVYPNGQFIFEIIFIWTLYLAGMTIFYKALGGK